ncbi:hypothetical protein [Flavivirga eckloniae]|uniref:hypothetical protein n=1 Tax=Flavivirga eckloniae TaxID=1803846 RepID=UPI0013159A06|nr:hypothetical protein [Flavivirga eckloniae]
MVLMINGRLIRNVDLYSILGKKLLDVDYNNLSEVSFAFKKIMPGLYLFKINDVKTSKLVIR